VDDGHTDEITKSASFTYETNTHTFRPIRRGEVVMMSEATDIFLGNVREWKHRLRVSPHCLVLGATQYEGQVMDENEE